MAITTCGGLCLEGRVQPWWGALTDPGDASQFSIMLFSHWLGTLFFFLSHLQDTGVKRPGTRDPRA